MCMAPLFFFFNDTATTEIYTLSLHDALPIYMTLGYGKLLADPVLADIAAAHGATPAQVALAWAMAKGYAVIPSSTQRAHLQANLDSCRLVLGAEDMQRIEIGRASCRERV